MSSLFGDLPETKDSGRSPEKAPSEAPRTDSVAKVDEPERSSKEPAPLKASSFLFVPVAARKRARVASRPAASTSIAVVRQHTRLPPSEAVYAIDAPRPSSPNQNRVNEEVEGAKEAESPSDSPTDKKSTAIASLSWAFSDEQLQAMRDDPYDPYQPNDFLVCRHEQAALQHWERLEQEREAALEAQDALRTTLRQERQALVERKEYSRLHAQGRGRGVSNLPAWLVAQQERERHAPP